MKVTLNERNEVTCLEHGNVCINGSGVNWSYSESTGRKQRNVPMGSLQDCLAEAQQRGCFRVADALKAIEDAKTAACTGPSLGEKDAKPVRSKAHIEVLSESPARSSVDKIKKELTQARASREAVRPKPGMTPVLDTVPVKGTPKPRAKAKK